MKTKDIPGWKIGWKVAMLHDKEGLNREDCGLDDSLHRVDRQLR